MPHLIQSHNCITMWRDACRYIIQNGNGFNLLVYIVEPLAYTSSQLAEITNSGIITATEVSNIINTIFPAKLRARNAALTNAQFYDLHERIYLRGKGIHIKNRSKWGNYFLRFTKFGTNQQNY